MAVKTPTRAPNSQLWLLQGDCKQKWNSLEKRITDHPFNHAVEVFVPGIKTLPSDLGQMLATPPSYYTAHLPLSHLIHPDIISHYVTSGSLTALSIGRRIDIDNVYALLSTGQESNVYFVCHPTNSVLLYIGKLIMSLEKDTYEQLGLQGRPSRYLKNQRFIVELDLVATHFKPGKPNYERVKWCLTDRLDLEADFIITWTNTDNSLSEMQFLQDFKALKRSCMSESENIEDFIVPTILGDQPHGHFETGVPLSCPADEFHTWLGVITNSSLSAVYDESAPDSYVSTFKPPEPYSISQYGIRTGWIGMVTFSYILKLLGSIRDYYSLEESRASDTPPWVVVNIWGFVDTPLSWRTNEHGHYISGDNHCSIVVFSNGHYWCLSALSSHDLV